MEICYANDSFHAKGILTPYFFIQGSMNLTYSGANINDEQITYTAADSDRGQSVVASAYLEFDALWERFT